MTDFPYYEIVLNPKQGEDAVWRGGCEIYLQTGDKVEVIQSRWLTEKTFENQDGANLFMRFSAKHYLRTSLGLSDEEIDKVKVTYR